MIDDPRPRTLSRRQIVRAGAWAAPVLVLATAAPAAAASPEPEGKPNLVFNNTTAGADIRYIPGQSVPQPPWYIPGYAVLSALDGNTSIRLAYYSANPSAVASAVTLTLTVSPANGLLSQKPTVVSGTGWSAISGSVSGNTAVYVFSYASPLYAGSGGPSDTTNLQFRLAGDDTTRVTDLDWPKAVTFQVTATGANSTTGSASVGGT